MVAPVKMVEKWKFRLRFNASVFDVPRGNLFPPRWFEICKDYFHVGDKTHGNDLLYIVSAYLSVRRGRSGSRTCLQCL